MNKRRCALFGVVSTGMIAGLGAAPTPDEDAKFPGTIEVTGVVRDFQEWSVQGGHPDFERRPSAGFGHYAGNIAETIGSNRKPVFTGEGFKVGTQWRDSESRKICHTLYAEDMGDAEGSAAQASTGGIQSAESFASWYEDYPGLNLSKPLTLVMEHVGEGRYVFDDSMDTHYKNVGFSNMGGFFPIDDEMYGNSPGTPNHNYHFTFELHLNFTYDADGNQYFKFIGDDDVWVFVNNKLVIDLGGVHAAEDQYVDMNRLGLVDGEVYSIDFFFAERHRTQSNFRIETNFIVESELPEATTVAFD